MVEHGTVGLIGLGEIGLPMASRLVQAGWRVVGYDVQGKALEQAVAAGVQRAGSPVEVARGPSTGRLSASFGHCRKRRRYYSARTALPPPNGRPSTWR